jgi:hypothetical protein
MFKAGCDPEIFLMDAASSLVSVVGRIGGNKYHPRPLSTLGDGYSVQEDNVAVEFNIPPAESKEQFVVAVEKTVEYLRDYFKTQSLQLSRSSADLFPIKELETPEARMFGCDPDFCAWTRGVNPRPQGVDHRLRSAGGHVHVGYKTKSLRDKFNLIKAMDLTHGVPSVFMDKGLLRKSLYGRAGCMRLKPYGVEYRVLSNYWIFSKEKTAWVWDGIEQAMELKKSIKSINEDAEIIQQAINENNKELAQKLVDKYDLKVLYA